MHVHRIYMHMHLVQVRLSSSPWTTTSSRSGARSSTPTHTTRRIGRDLAEAGLPDLGWYDLLWTLYRALGRSLRVNELAREVVLSPTAMSRFVDRAEAAGVRGARPTRPTGARCKSCSPTRAELLRKMPVTSADRGALQRARRRRRGSVAASARAGRRLGALDGAERQLVLGDSGRDALGQEAEVLEQRLRGRVGGERRAGQRGDPAGCARATRC